MGNTEANLKKGFYHAAVIETTCTTTPMSYFKLGNINSNVYVLFPQNREYQTEEFYCFLGQC